MKKQSFGIAVVSLLSLFPLSAMANEKQSAKVHFDDPVSILGVRLQAGDYTLRWSGSGPDVQVEILQGKKEIGTAPATVVAQRNQISPTIFSDDAKDGFEPVTEIGFSKLSLEFSK